MLRGSLNNARARHNWRGVRIGSQKYGVIERARSVVFLTAACRAEHIATYRDADTGESSSDILPISRKSLNASTRPAVMRHFFMVIAGGPPKRKHHPAKAESCEMPVGDVEIGGAFIGLPRPDKVSP